MGLLSDILLGDRRRKDLRRYLERRLKETIVDKFQHAGFEKVALRRDEGDAEWRTAYHLGRLKRRRDGSIDDVEIELDKRGFPSF